MQRNTLYDGTGRPGVALLEHVIQALSQENLIRTSHFAGGEINGLVPNTCVGSLGYCVHDLGATWTIDVVLSGEACGVSYRKWKEWGGDEVGTIMLHEPKDAHRLYEPIKRIFETLGFSVQKVDVTTYQMHWDDDITYQVTVQAAQT